MKLKILKLDFAQAEESRRADTCKLGQVDFEKFSKVANGHSGFSVCYTD